MEDFLVPTWNPSYSVGVDYIDVDFNIILNVLGVIELEIQNFKRPNVLENAKRFLVKHVCAHFKREETDMKRQSYPGFERHSNQHMDYLSNMGELLDAIGRGDLCSEILSAHADWWSDHVRGASRNFVEYLESDEKIAV